VKITIVDGFNAVKRKFVFETTTNTTLFEFRFRVGKEINAYVHEMNIFTEDGLLDERLNGLTVHQAQLSGPLTIERRVKIDRSPLMEAGVITKEANRVLGKIFS
jgi:ubiquitin carboxyl-terminal hydrolase 34